MIGVLFLGDSITFGTGVGLSPTIPESCATALTSLAGYTVRSVNAGVGGALSTDFLPGAANDVAALAAGAAGACSVMHLMIGTNDAYDVQVSAATHQSNLQSIADTWVARGYVVVISYVIYCNNAHRALSTLLSYQAKVDLVCNGTTIIRGDTAGYAAFAAHDPSWLQDGVHPNQTGADALGGLWATGLLGAVQQAARLQARVPAIFG